MSATPSFVPCIWKDISLPVALLEEIHAYLIVYDYYRLLISSKKLFSQIKYETWRIGIFSRETEDLQSTFQKCSSLINDPRHQLTINTSSSHDVKVFQFLTHLPLLKLKAIVTETNGDWKEIISNKRHLEFDFDFTDEGLEFPALEIIDSLTLWNLDGVITFHSLANLKKLELNYCYQFAEVSYFKNLDELIVCGCPLVQDVSDLGNIRKLEITECENLKDISALTNNYSLSVTYCLNISKVPSEMRTRNFKTDLDSNLIHQIKFSQLRIFKFRETFESFFMSEHNLFSITLQHCNILKHLSTSFRRIPVVRVDNCEQLTDISGLGENKSVAILSCPNLKDFSVLRFLPKVSLFQCNITNAEDLDHVHHLSLGACNKLEDINCLSVGVKHLVLSSWRIEKYENLCRIPIVEFGTSPWAIMKAIARGKQINYFEALGSDHVKIVFPRKTFEYFNENFPLMAEYDKISEFHHGEEMITLLRKRS
jgi:hypothetical protein